MKSIVFFCITSLAASAPSKTVTGGDFETVATVEMRINPVKVSSTKGRLPPINHIHVEGGGESGYLEAVAMLENLEDEVNDLGVEMTKNANDLVEVKDSLRLLDEAVLELQQQQQNRSAVGTCTVDSNSLICAKSVIDGTQWPSPRWYGPSNVLKDSCDDLNDYHDASNVDWWAAPNKATGSNAFFEVDLGCQKCVSQVTVRNSGNGKPADRGTKEFLVSVATQSAPDNWIPVIRSKLADVGGQRCEDQVGKVTFNFDPRMARYARFEIISYYRSGAVLQFFDMN